MLIFALVMEVSEKLGGVSSMVSVAKRLEKERSIRGRICLKI